MHVFPFPLKHTTPRFFFFFSLTLLYYIYFFLGGPGEGSVRGIQALPHTGGWLPHSSVFNPLSSPTLRLCFIMGGGVLRYMAFDKYVWPGPQGPQPACSIGKRSGFFERFVGGLFLSPVRGSGISQEVGRWLPHAGDLLPHGPHPPFLITSRKRWDAAKQSWLPQPGD